MKMHKTAPAALVSKKSESASVSTAAIVNIMWTDLRSYNISNEFSIFGILHETLCETFENNQVEGTLCDTSALLVADPPAPDNAANRDDSVVAGVAAAPAVLSPPQDPTSQALNSASASSSDVADRAVIAHPSAMAHADFRCPICGYCAENTPGLRYHMTLKHGLSERELAMQKVQTFRFEDHSWAGMPTCKHCMRAFTGVSQFRNHIMAQACPVLHGVTTSARDYGQTRLPPLPKSADTSCTPLRDRETTLQYLQQGGWLSSQETHTQKHKAHSALIKQVIAECRTDKLALEKPCQLCGREWQGAPIRHRESCAALFAAHLLEALLCPSAPDARHSDGGVRGGFQHLVSADGQQEIQTGSNDRPVASTDTQRPRKGKGQRARSGQLQVWRLPATADTGDQCGAGPPELRQQPFGLRHSRLDSGATAASLEDGSSEQPASGDAVSHGPHESTDDATRDGALGTQSRHGLYDASASGLQRHRQAAVSSQQRILGEEGPRVANAAHAEADPSAYSLSRPEGSAGAAGDQNGSGCTHAQDGVVPCHRESVDVPALVARKGDLGTGGSAAHEPSRIAAGTPGIHHGAAGGGSRPSPVQHDQEALGGLGSDASVLPESLFAGSQSPEPLSATASSVRARLPPVVDVTLRRERLEPQRLAKQLQLPQNRGRW